MRRLFVPSLAWAAAAAFGLVLGSAYPELFDAEASGDEVARVEGVEGDDALVALALGDEDELEGFP